MMPTVDILRVLALPAMALVVLAWVLHRSADPGARASRLTVVLVIAAITATAVALIAGLS
jgi:hypothetical protein